MSDEIERLLHRAHAQIAHQDMFGAVETLRRALSLDVDNARAHALLALCLRDQKRIEAAAHEAGLALTIAPDSALTQFAAGVVETARRRFSTAEQHFQSALALDPQDTASMRALAELYVLWNRSAEALQLLERARDIDPDDAANWAELAEHYRIVREFERAEQCTRQALEIDPENAQALICMGHLLLRDGKTDDAREHALIVLRNNALNHGAILLLCAVKARQSVLLGFWWRFNSLLSGGSITRRVVLLIGMYLVYRVSVLATGDLGYSSAMLPLNLAWLGFCVYTWVGPAMFSRQLAKELAPARLGSSY